MVRRQVGPSMQDVILDEVAGADARPDGSELPSDGRAVMRWAARHAVLAAFVTTAVVVAAVVVPPRWSIAAERRAVALPAMAPGFLHSQPAAPAAVWSAAVTGDDQLLLAGDTVVAWSPRSDVTEVTGIDLVTGAERWHAQLPAAVPGTLRRCFAVQASSGHGPAGHPDGTRPWDVVCLGVGRGAVDAAGRLLQRTGPVVVLDALDGSEVARREPSGGVGDAVVVGGDLVMVVASPHGLVVVRQDVWAGTERWRTTLRVGPPPAVVSRLTVVAGAGVVLVTGVGLATAVAAQDGRFLVDLVDPSPLLDATLLSDGSVVAASSGLTDRAIQASTTVYGRDGQVGFTVAGTVSEPGVTNDAAHRVYAWSVRTARPFDGRLVALDRGTGAPLWTALGPAAGPVMDVAGVAVVHGPGSVTGLDARTGRQVWRTPVSVGARGLLMTDGRLLLLAYTEPGSGTVLDALRLRDGSTAWQSILPAGITRVVQLGANLVGVGPGLVVALR